MISRAKQLDMAVVLVHKGDEAALAGFDPVVVAEAKKIAGVLVVQPAPEGLKVVAPIETEPEPEPTPELAPEPEPEPESEPAPKPKKVKKAKKSK